MVCTLSSTLVSAFCLLPSAFLPKDEGITGHYLMHRFMPLTA